MMSKGASLPVVCLALLSAAACGGVEAPDHAEATAVAAEPLAGTLGDQPFQARSAFTRRVALDPAGNDCGGVEGYGTIYVFQGEPDGAMPGDSVCAAIAEGSVDPSLFGGSLFALRADVRLGREMVEYFDRSGDAAGPCAPDVTALDHRMGSVRRTRAASGRIEVFKPSSDDDRWLLRVRARFEPGTAKESSGEVEGEVSFTLCP